MATPEAAGEQTSEYRDPYSAYWECTCCVDEFIIAYIILPSISLLANESCGLGEGTISKKRGRMSLSFTALQNDDLNRIIFGGLPRGSMKRLRRETVDSDSSGSGTEKDVLSK